MKPKADGPNSNKPDGYQSCSSTLKVCFIKNTHLRNNIITDYKIIASASPSLGWYSKE